MKQEKINNSLLDSEIQEINIKDAFYSLLENTNMFERQLKGINSLSKGLYTFLKNNLVNNDGVLDNDDIANLNDALNHYIKVVKCLDWKSAFIDNLLQDTITRLKYLDDIFNNRVNALSFFNDGDDGNAIYTNDDKPIRELLLFRLGSIKNIKDTTTIFIKKFYNLLGISRQESNNTKPYDILDYSFNPYKEMDKNTSGLVMNQLLGIIAKCESTISRVENINKMLINTKNKLQEYLPIFKDLTLSKHYLDDDDYIEIDDNKSILLLGYNDLSLINDIRGWKNRYDSTFDDFDYLERFLYINGVDKGDNKYCEISTNINVRNSLNETLYKHYFFNKMGKKFGLCMLDDDDTINYLNECDIIDSDNSIDFNNESMLFWLNDTSINDDEIAKDIEKRKQEIYKEMENK